MPTGNLTRYQNMKVYVDSLVVGGNTISGTEIGFTDGVTAGTALASKALVLDSSKGIATITSLTATTFAGTPNFSGATTFASTIGVTGVLTPTGGITAAGGYAVTARAVAHSGGNPPLAAADGTNLDIVTTETYRCEVYVPANFSSTGIAVFNGTAVAGNLQAWLIDSTGTGIASLVTASTAAAGTTAYQRIPWVSGPFVIKGPATYWIAIQGNNAGGDLRTHVVGTFGADKQSGTAFGTLTVAAAPTTFTTGVGPMATLY